MLEMVGRPFLRTGMYLLVNRVMVSKVVMISGVLTSIKDPEEKVMKLFCIQPDVHLITLLNT